MTKPTKPSRPGLLQNTLHRLNERALASIRGGIDAGTTPPTKQEPHPNPW